MLYDSLKQTVIAYNERKQAQQSYEQKHVFKWKIITLIFAVILIGSFGLLSQLYKDLVNQKVNKYNTTFLKDMLANTQQLQTIGDVQHLVYGFYEEDDIKFDTSYLLFAGSQFTTKSILDAVTGTKNLVYIWRTDKGKFAFTLRKAFDEDYVVNHVVEVKEPKANKESMSFSLYQNYGRKFNKAEDCALYRYDKSNKVLTFMELFELQDTTPPQLSVFIPKESKDPKGNFKCYDSTVQKAALVIENLVGKEPALGQPFILSINRLEIYELKMNQ